MKKQDIEPKDENRKVDIAEMCSADDESGDGQSTKTQDDVDSEVTFEDGAKIRYRTHKKMKWKLAQRLATSPSERWLKKAAEWNPGLSSRYKTNRAIGRPRKRWEDDINDFFKQVLDETKMKTQSKEGIKPTIIGSALPKTGGDRLY